MPRSSTCFLSAVCATVCALAIASSAAALRPEARSRGGQRPEVRGRIDAFVQALSSGSPERFEAMAQASFSPELLAARTPDNRRQMVDRVHTDFGELTIENEDVTAPGHFELEAKGSKGGTLGIALDLLTTEPYKILKIELKAGDAGGPGRGGRGDSQPALPPPSIDPGMSPGDMSAALDAYLGRLAASGDFAGVVLVGRNGAQIFEKAYGVADREHGVPMTPDLRFNVASIGKAFTKTAIGQLLSAGTLSPGDTIGKVLPDYPDADLRRATIDQLLNHTAGVADFFGPRFTSAPKDRFQSNADYFSFVAHEPPLFKPGTRNQYCNGCYIVLGEIIAKISGMAYEQYIADHVFRPAGMTGAGFLAYGDPKVAPGYTRHGEEEGKLVSNAAMHGHHGSAAGGAYARAADLFAFDNALRERRLLDAKMTAWYLEGPTTTGRAPGAYGIAGGAPGANADVESNATWIVIAVGNLDPPNAVRVATAIMRTLGG